MECNHYSLRSVGFRIAIAALSIAFMLQPVLAKNAEVSKVTAREKRPKRAKLKYPVLYNQDCTDLFDKSKGKLTAQDVQRMVDEVADGGTDVLLLNPNAQLGNYPSKVWQTF